jgi:hypothetical protein
VIIPNKGAINFHNIHSKLNMFITTHNGMYNIGNRIDLIVARIAPNGNHKIRSNHPNEKEKS